MWRGAKRKRDGEGGQAMVEAAIVLPMYVFLLLGLLQLGLMHQARLLTKYAAYRAVRAGSMNNARVDRMQAAALTALLPLVSIKSNGVELIEPIESATDYATKWLKFGLISSVGLPFMLDGVPLRYVEVDICGPLTGDFTGDLAGRQEIDFDDPEVAGPDAYAWEKSNLTRLRVQVTFNYRMPIPFANWVIHHMATGREIAPYLHLQSDDILARLERLKTLQAYLRYSAVAEIFEVYVFPIRANYAMRMQSNIYMSQLPDENECQIPFKKKS